MPLEPLRCFGKTSVGEDRVCASGGFESTVPALLIVLESVESRFVDGEDNDVYMKIFLSTATGRYSTRFDTADQFRRTVEVDIALPVAKVIHATTMQPITLNPVDHVLQIGIIAIALNHDHQLFFTFVLDLQVIPSVKIKA